jgi:1-acyl-sn-glycerol-3-phosphate acyltransferase
LFFKIFFHARVYGKKLMPQQGACIVVLNHEGYWDAHLAQCLLPRRIAFLAKNSEFPKKFLRYIFKLIHAIPVRRYEIDPSCIRNTLNWLARDQAVGIFIAGERCWDGRLAQPKRGTIKLLIKANVPIVPVRIKGSYELLPRWAPRIQLYPVSLYIGEPFLIDAGHRTVDKASREVMRRLSILGEGHIKA